MSLLISIGSNTGNRSLNLSTAIDHLSESFNIKFKSRIYESPAVDYLDQPDFYNQILELDLPPMDPISCLNILLEIEKKMGRVRDINKGPRNIDIDLLFWATESISLPGLDVPHPRLFQRSFIVLPLKELPYFETLNNNFKFPQKFNNTAVPLGLTD